MADSCFQEVILDRPAHEVVVHRRLGHLFVVFDRLVVIRLEGCKIRNLEEELIREPVSTSARFQSASLPLEKIRPLLPPIPSTMPRKSCKRNKHRKKNSRLRIIRLEPSGRQLVRFERAARVAHLDLEHLGQVLLVRGRAPEVALARVVRDGLPQHARRVLRVGLAVRLEGFRQRVGCVVRLRQVLGLDRGRALECQAGFFACRGW